MTMMLCMLGNKKPFLESVRNARLEWETCFVGLNFLTELSLFQSIISTAGFFVLLGGVKGLNGSTTGDEDLFSVPAEQQLLWRAWALSLNKDRAICLW